jgi:serine/threonine-protein kinase
MGEVYEARDTLLGRRVAIKILSAELSIDSSARDRLVREAKALAALSHPNIGAIYGLEMGANDASGRPATALVLELIEGQTLAEKVARGPLSIADALHVGAQVACALATAHEKGIVHRDLKPANIKVTPAGVVKVLDFGLAKTLVDADATGNTRTEMVTHHGTVLGTPAYMSPEQVRGQDVDARTDVWAFGCVLYEMLAGRRAFDGSTSSDCMSAVLEREPDWSLLPSQTSSETRALLRRCLQKDRTRRLRDTGDVQLMLEDSSAAVPTGASPPAEHRRSLIAALFALAAAMLGGIAVWVARPNGPAIEPSSMRVEIVPSASDPVNVATTTPNLAMSRDGTRLAWASYSQDPSSGGPLVVRDVGELMPRRVEGAPRVRDPSFSSDGQWVLYYSGGPGLYKVPTAGGTPTTILTEVAGARGTSWAEDGTIVYATTEPETGLLRVSDSGGTPTVLTTPDKNQGEADHVLPSVLPNGRGILYTVLHTAAEPSVAVFDTRNQSQKMLIPGAASAHYIDAGCDEGERVARRCATESKDNPLAHRTNTHLLRRGPAWGRQRRRSGLPAWLPDDVRY